MRSLQPFVLALILSSVAVVAASAQQPSAAPYPSGCELVYRSLVDQGMSDIKFDAAESGYVVSYDDRISRQPYGEAIQNAERVSRISGECDVQSIRASRYGLFTPPVSPTGLLDRPASRPTLDPGARFELELQVTHDYEVDFYLDPIRDRVAVAPKLRMWWPSGLMIEGQYAFPVLSQVPGRQARYYDTSYPVMFAAGMKRQIRPSVFASVSGGLYPRNRYGGELQAYWVSDQQPIVLGVRLSATGYWSWQDNIWGSTSIDTFTGYVDGTWFMPWYKLRARAKAGRFFLPKPGRFRRGVNLMGEVAAMGELTRVFGETEIGFSGYWGGNYLYPGIQVSIPLSPRRGVSKGRASAFMTRRMNYPWDLGRVLRGQSTGRVVPLRGTLFSTGFDVWEDLRFLSPHMASRLK